MASHNLPIPVTADPRSREISGIVERVISEVPASFRRASSSAGLDAEQVAREAARNAGLVSASLALPPGPLGMLTVLPDLYLIWKIQRQMVADIFALHGRAAELTSAHMLYCLFRHMASHVVRDVVVRASERALVSNLSSSALRHALGSLGTTVAKRLAGTSASRWVPLAGAAAVGAYAYWDTLQVAKTARRLIDATPEGKMTIPRAEYIPARGD